MEIIAKIIVVISTRKTLKPELAENLTLDSGFKRPLFQCSKSMFACGRNSKTGNITSRLQNYPGWCGQALRLESLISLSDVLCLTWEWRKHVLSQVKLQVSNFLSKLFSIKSSCESSKLRTSDSLIACSSHSNHYPPCPSLCTPRDVCVYFHRNSREVSQMNTFY